MSCVHSKRHATHHYGMQQQAGDPERMAIVAQIDFAYIARVQKEPIPSLWKCSFEACEHALYKAFERCYAHYNLYCFFGKAT